MSLAGKKAWKTRLKNLELKKIEDEENNQCYNIYITMTSGSKMLLKHEDVLEIKNIKGIIYKK